MHTHRSNTWSVSLSCLLLTLSVIGTTRSAGAQVDFRLPSRSVDLKRYTTTFQCVSASVSANTPGMLAANGVSDAIASGQYGPDTSEYDPNRGAPARSVAAARRCLQSLPSVGQLQPEELGTMRRLALIAGNDSLALAATARELALPENATIPQRPWALESVMEDFLSARPAKTAVAQTYLDQLDAMGSRAFLARSTAHMSFLKHAQAILDVNMFAREIKAMDALGDLEIAAGGSYTQTGGQMKTISRFLRARLSTLQRGPIAAINNRTQDDSLLRGMSIGEKIPPLPVTYWFRKPGPFVPTPGKVTYLYTIPEYNRDSYEDYAALRRFAKKFPSVEIVVLARSYGWFRSEVLAPAEEAERMRARFLDTLSLPGALGIVGVPIKKRAAPDFRVDYEVPEWKPGLLSGGNLILPDGRLVDQIGPTDERMLDAVTRAVLDDPSVQKMMR